MPRDTATVLDEIRAGNPPAVILVGGDNEYLTEGAFRDLRDAVSADPRRHVETFSETADLAEVIDSYRTMSLFSSKRLLVVPEVNAFVTKKEVSELYEKALNDWSTAKTERKRSGAVAKFLHLLGLIGSEAGASEEEVASAVGARKRDKALGELLEFVKATGKKPTRGEGDADLLAEAIARGGAPGTVMLLKTGEIPAGSATIHLIEKNGAVVVCNLTREAFSAAFKEALGSVARESRVRFEPEAVSALRDRLGIDRVLNDKFSREVPDLRLAVGEAERLATFAGEGGTVTPAIVGQQTQSLEGGARWEFGSLYTDRKPVEAVAKLRDLIAQARRDDPRTALDIQYGKFLFPLADEIRQLIGIHSFAHMHGVDLRRAMQFNRFRDTLAEPLSEYLKEQSIVRQKPHPFALYRKFEAARNHSVDGLLAALSDLAELEFARKSGGVPPEIGLEAIVLSS
jgi:DNA polymerase III delta subunit